MTFTISKYFELTEALKPRSRADEKKVFDRFLYATQRKRHNGSLRLSDAIRAALTIEDITDKIKALEECKKTLLEIRKKLNQI
jgi:hypothetical protein